jgi:hypothetical protein
MEVGGQTATAARMPLLAGEIQAQKYVRVFVKCFQLFRESNISQISKHLYPYLLLFHIVNVSV